MKKILFFVFIFSPFYLHGKDLPIKNLLNAYQNFPNKCKYKPQSLDCQYNLAILGNYLAGFLNGLTLYCKFEENEQYAKYNCRDINICLPKHFSPHDLILSADQLEKKYLESNNDIKEMPASAIFKIIIEQDYKCKD